MMSSKRSFLMLGLLAALIATLLTWNFAPAQSQSPQLQKIESDDAQILREGQWATQTTAGASGGSYIYNGASPEAYLQLTFSGTIVEILYVSGPNMGTLVIEVDGTVLRTVITAAEQTRYGQVATISYLSQATHTLRVYPQAGGVIGVDAFSIPREEGTAQADTEGSAASVPCQPNAQIEKIAHTVGEWGVTYGGPTISDDGRYVVFQSLEPLVANDTNGVRDVFVYDRQTCIIERISSSSIGGEISDDGRYVAFISGNNVYRYDRQTGTTQIASVGSNGSMGYQPSYSSAISGNGRYVAFTSENRFSPADTNIYRDVYRHDMVTGETVLVSVNTEGVVGNHESNAPTLSDDGRFVAFDSYAWNLAPNDTNATYDIFVRDLETNTTVAVSVSTNGEFGTMSAGGHSISGNGRYVAFNSGSNLLPGSGWSRSFIRDLQTNTTSAAVLDAAGRPANGYGWLATLSDDGRYVAFISDSPNLVAGDTNNQADLFWHDRQTGEIKRVEPLSTGQQPNGKSSDPVLSGDGKIIAFMSEANNLVASDNTGLDVFVYDPDALVQPNVLQATAAGYTQINLTWVYYAHDATEFRLERSPNGVSDWSEIAVLPVATTTHSDSTLTDGTTYYYRVRAYRSDDMVYSAYSNIASATTRFYPLAAPSNLIASNPSGPTDLTWEDVNGNETEFRIERTSNGINWVAIGMTAANTVIYRDSNITCSSTYQYRVRAYRSQDRSFSPYSNVATVTTSPCPMLAPTNLTSIGFSRTSVRLSWVDNTLNESAFRIERSPDGTTDWSEIASVSSNTMTYIDSSLTCATSYSYRVRAYRESDQLYSPYSNSVSVTTALCQLSAPHNLVATILEDSQVQLEWAEESPDESSFYILRTVNNLYSWTVIQIAPANTTAYFDGAITCGATYYYQVIAYRQLDMTYSAYSNVAEATTHACPPNAPSALSATVVSADEIQLIWVDHSADESEFVIEKSLNGTTDWVLVARVAADETSYSHTGLTCGTNYYFRVRAYRDADQAYSPYSASAMVTSFPCADTLALFNPTAHTAAFLKTLETPPATRDYTQFATGFPYGTGGQYLTGDWNGDGVETLGVYRGGAFFFTNENGTATHWDGIWFGLGGQPVVGRFDANVNHDCLGVTDSGTWTNGDTFFALYFTCNLTSGPTPPLTFQWLSILLPNSQGFTGAFQFVAGDFNGDGVDSVAVRRGTFIAWTNVPPTTLLSQFNLAQYIGTPGTGDAGKVVAGDWDLNNVDSFGLVYQNGTFYRRNDVEWNTGVYLLQTFTPLVGAPFDVANWRPN